MTHSITAIINYCTNDYQFLRPNIIQLKKFCQQIIVPVCDHFYDGSPENKSLLARSIKANPEAQFIKFKYNPRKTKNLWRGWQYILRKLQLGEVWGPQYWIGYSRQLGLKKINKNIDYCLLLDADEIVDGQKFLKWLNTKKYQKFNCLKPANYWYWRSPRYQSLNWEDSGLLVKKAALDPTMIINHDERNGIYLKIKNPKTRLVTGLNNQPMVHHYDWARPKKNLLKKVQTWGHTKDRNWTKLIEAEFSHPFSNTDFIYQRRYKTVKPFVNITG